MVSFDRMNFASLSGRGEAVQSETLLSADCIDAMASVLQRRTGIPFADVLDVNDHMEEVTAISMGIIEMAVKHFQGSLIS